MSDFLWQIVYSNLSCYLPAGLSHPVTHKETKPGLEGRLPPTLSAHVNHIIYLTLNRNYFYIVPLWVSWVLLSFLREVDCKVFNLVSIYVV